MKCKEDLVFEKHTGALTDFVDLGEGTNHLDNCEEPKHKVAKTVDNFRSLKGISIPCNISIAYHYANKLCI